MNSYKLQRFGNKRIFLIAQFIWFINTIVLISVRLKLIEIYEIINRHSIITNDIIYIVPTSYILLICLLYNFFSSNKNIFCKKIIKLFLFLSILCGIIFFIYIFYCMNILLPISIGIGSCLGCSKSAHF